MLSRDFKHYARNYLGASVGFIAGGIAGAWGSDIFFDSEATNSIVSTISQYFTGSVVFGYGHFKTYEEHFKEKGNVFWNVVKDIGKAYAVFTPAEVAYILARPSLMCYLQKEGMDSVSAAVVADLITIPSHFLLTLPLAKKADIIKGDIFVAKNGLEVKLEE